MTPQELRNRSMQFAIRAVTEEADEGLGWLELIAELELARGPELLWLLVEAQELVAIFGSSYATAKEKDRRSRDRRSVDVNRRSPDRRSPDSASGAPP